MEWIMLLKTVLALAFVLGLLLLMLWAVKYCELKGGKNRFIRRLQENQRLSVVEIRRIDARNSVVLIRRDETEHLLLLGSTQNLLLESNINIKEKAEK